MGLLSMEHAGMVSAQRTWVRHRLLLLHTCRFVIRSSPLQLSAVHSVLPSLTVLDADLLSAPSGRTSIFLIAY